MALSFPSNLVLQQFAVAAVHSDNSGCFGSIVFDMVAKELAQAKRRRI
jgi:hypothetical protein